MFSEEQCKATLELFIKYDRSHADTTPSSDARRATR